MGSAMSRNEIRPDAAAECRQLFVRFVNATDRKDFDAAFALLAPGAVVIRRGEEFATEEAIRTLLRRRPADETIRHIVTNMEVAIEAGGRTASGIAYFTAYMTRHQGLGAPLSAPDFVGDYLAEFVEIEGRWLFSRHEAVSRFVRQHQDMSAVR